MNIRIYLGTSLLVCISFFAGHAADFDTELAPNPRHRIVIIKAGPDSGVSRADLKALHADMRGCCSMTCCLCCCCCGGAGYLICHDKKTLLKAATHRNTPQCNCCWDSTSFCATLTFLACCCPCLELICYPERRRENTDGLYQPCQNSRPPCADKWNQGGCNNICVWRYLMRDKLPVTPRRPARIVPAPPLQNEM